MQNQSTPVVVTLQCPSCWLKASLWSRAVLPYLLHVYYGVVTAKACRRHGKSLPCCYQNCCGDVICSFIPTKNWSFNIFILVLHPPFPHPPTPLNSGLVHAVDTGFGEISIITSIWISHYTNRSLCAVCTKFPSVVVVIQEQI